MKAKVVEAVKGIPNAKGLTLGPLLFFNHINDLLNACNPCIDYLLTMQV